MAIAERIISYTARVIQTNLQDSTRIITLKLESGTVVWIGFSPVRPANWLQFPAPGQINIEMYATDYDDVYHLLQTEKPVFCTALDLFGLQVASVHTELDLSLGEPTGEGYADQSLEALIVRARAAQAESAVQGVAQPDGAVPAG
jgi:hypothetical protein